MLDNILKADNENNNDNKEIESMLLIPGAVKN